MHNVGAQLQERNDKLKMQVHVLLREKLQIRLCLQVLQQHYQDFLFIHRVTITNLEI